MLSAASAVAQETTLDERAGPPWSVSLAADASFQTYDVRSTAGGAYLRVRRYVQTIDTEASYEFGERVDPTLSFGASLRLDQDFGDTCLIGRDACIDDTSRSNEGAFAPLARNTMLDVPSLWLAFKWPRIRSELRAGRMMVVDSAGFARLDGGMLQVEPTSWLRLRASGGERVSNASFAGTNAFVPAGPIRVERSNEELDDTIGEGALAPAVTLWTYGGSARVQPFDGARAEFSFRETREVEGLVERRFGAEVVVEPVSGYAFYALGRLDALLWQVTDGAVGARAEWKPVTTSLAFVRHVPVFDAGSIWWFFEPAATNSIELTSYVDVSRALQLGLLAEGRATELDKAALDGAVEPFATLVYRGFHFRLSQRIGSGDLGVAANTEFAVTRDFDSKVNAFFRFSVWHYDDELRSSAHATSVASTLGAEFRMTPRTRLALQVDHATSELVGQRLRAVALFSFEAWR